MTHIALYLARNNYYSGNPETVLNSNGTLVIQAYQYEMFCREYENAVIDMQQKEFKK